MEKYDLYEKTSIINSIDYIHEALNVIKNNYLHAMRPFVLFVKTDKNYTSHTLSNLNNIPEKLFINEKYDESLSVYAHGLESSNEEIFLLINELKK